MVGKTASKFPFATCFTLALVFLKRRFIPVDIHRETALFRHFVRDFYRETVGIVQTERLLAADDRFGYVIGVLLAHKRILTFDTADAFFKLFQALL